MEGVQVELIAGTVSSLIFASSNIPMLIKVFKTHDLRSYSLVHIGLGNVGNVIHWLYVASLPFGPIWLLHGFFTLTMLLLLIGYLRYEKRYPSRRSKADTSDNPPKALLPARPLACD